MADKNKIMFLFGSETGNSESISKRLHSDAEALGYSSTWNCLRDYEKVFF